MVFVTFTIAVDTETSWDWTVQWLKMAVIFPLLVVGVIRTRKAFNLFVVANLLGAFWWGWESWLDPKRAESRLLNVGSGDTLNDNGAAAHLLTLLPLALIYLLTEKDKRLRAVALVATPFIVNTHHSVQQPGRDCCPDCGICGWPCSDAQGLSGENGCGSRSCGGAGVLLMADQQFLDRQQTTTNYEEDGSAQQRLTTWKAAFRLVKDQAARRRRARFPSAEPDLHSRNRRRTQR